MGHLQGGGVKGHFGEFWGIIGHVQKGYFKIHSGVSHNSPKFLPKTPPVP